MGFGTSRVYSKHHGSIANTSPTNEVFVSQVKVTSFKDRKDSRSAGSSMRSFLGSGGFGEACKTREFFSLSSNPCSCALVSFSFSCHSTNSRSFLTTSLQLNSNIIIDTLNSIPLLSYILFHYPYWKLEIRFLQRTSEGGRHDATHHLSSSSVCQRACKYTSTLNETFTQWYTPTSNTNCLALSTILSILLPRKSSDTIFRLFQFRTRSVQGNGLQWLTYLDHIINKVSETEATCICESGHHTSLFSSMVGCPGFWHFLSFLLVSSHASWLAAGQL